MTGVTPDYTEIMILKDTTRSWKIALFLTLLTTPQILVIAWLMNQTAGGLWGQVKGRLFASVTLGNDTENFACMHLAFLLCEVSV